ncbi:MAG: hypothetical protein ACPGUH_02065 [Winogradskyella sp.]
MGFSIAKLFNTKISKPESNDSIEAILKAVENTPYGISENNVLFAGLNELGGYFFFQTVIVGELSVKCKNGASLLFSGTHFELKLESDMPEFESDRSDVKGRYLTKIDFQIEKSDIKKLEKATLKNIQLSVKKHRILFTKHVVSDEEE